MEFFSRNMLVSFLSMYLLFFLMDGMVSVMDDGLILAFGSHFFSGMRIAIGLIVMLIGFFVYLMMAFTQWIPKRFFLPLTLARPIGFLGMILGLIYNYKHLEVIAFATSFLQLIFSAVMWVWIQGGVSWRWPVVRSDLLGKRGFSWLNFFGFTALNLFLFLPGVVLYLAFCASLAVDHFSDGFMVLHADRVSVKAKTFNRPDGKTIQLIPMIHVGDAYFYKKISQLFPENSMVLLEGVSDRNQIMKTKVSYQQLAGVLGLVEQKQEFEVLHAVSRKADVDISEFSKVTQDYLKEVAELYSGKMTVDKLVQFSAKPRPEELVEILLNDVLYKRNEHLVGEIRKELKEADHLVVPWGAAHIPGVAREIQKDGFTAEQSIECDVFHFKNIGNRMNGISLLEGKK